MLEEGWSTNISDIKDRHARIKAFGSRIRKAVITDDITNNSKKITSNRQIII